MRRITIIGANSYIGDSFIRLADGKDYSFKVIDASSADFNIEALDLSGTDVVLNLAAIVHRPKEKDEVYYSVNRDLAVRIANIAKKSQVAQFIQMSTKGVFGVDFGFVDDSTQYNPKTTYEKSKLEADLLLGKMRSDSFKICIVRPPMVYGLNCRGNYPKLEKIAIRSPLFPKYKNEKDLIYIGNLVWFLFFAVDNCLDGTFYPKNPSTICVSEMVRLIALYNNHKIRFFKFLNPIIKLLVGKNRKITSVFATSVCKINDGCGFVPPYDLTSSLEEMYLKK